MTKVYISPQADQVSDDNGVGRIIKAQFHHLPSHGVELVSNPDHADVIACHISADGLPRVDVLHTHGLYWSDTPDLKRWHHEANRRIIDAARRAMVITVPSEWVAMPFKRDMRIVPEVIGHGIDLGEWSRGKPGGYALWGKNRAGDVCDPTPAYELARRGIPVISTFAPRGAQQLDNLTLTGALPHAEMKDLIRNASVYLATAPETFGIQTLEALACGVPVLGFNWRGTGDIITHQVDGYLVEPDDYDGLLRGWIWLQEHDLSENCRLTAQAYSWPAIMARYADLYKRIAEQRAQEELSVSIVITNYNYGRYLEEAISSAQNQTVPPKEIIIVDDGSTDESRRILDDFARRDDCIQVHFQSNGGVASARNNGIRAATGSLLVCLDADDRLDPDYIRLSLPHFKARALGVAYPGLRIFNDDTPLTPYQPTPFDWHRQATPANPPNTCIPACSMFRREMWERVGGYKQVYAPAEDAEFWTRGLSVGFTAKPSGAWYDYRVHGKGEHNTKQYRQIDTWHPWMRDRQYPMAAPQTGQVIVRHYAEPIVSVIIPVGPGHAQYLPGALDSLLGQTLREWEAVIVNDSGEPIPDGVLRTYPFISIINTEGREGAGVARNKGVRFASAPLTLFLDADDYIAPDTLAKMVSKFLKTGRYVYTDWMALDETGVSEHKAPEYKPEAWLKIGQHAVTALVPTEWAKQIEFPDLPGWEEWAYYLEYAIRGWCGVRLAEPLLYYRTSTGTRRKESFEQAESLKSWVADKYSNYVTGKKSMCGCGNRSAGQTILGVRSSLTRAYNYNGEGAIMPLSSGQEGIRYTGGMQGSVWFQGNGGRRYKVSQGWEAPVGEGDGMVHPDDLGKFINRADFTHVLAAPVSPVVVPPALEQERVDLPQHTPQELEALREEMIALDGIGPDLADKLVAAGIVSVEAIKNASDDVLIAIDGIGSKLLKNIRKQLK